MKRMEKLIVPEKDENNQELQVEVELKAFAK